MRFIKIKAEKIFDGQRFVQGKVLVLKDDGRVDALIDAQDAGDDIMVLEGIVSPGFINCHCHLELSHLKGNIEEGKGLLTFVGEVVQKRRVDRDRILQAIAVAEAEMLENGIVAVGDICNSTDTLHQKSGKRLYYHNFIEVLGADPRVSEKNFETFEKIYAAFCATPWAGPVSLTPHAPYSVSSPLWEKTVRHPGNTLMSIHNQETVEENQWFENKTGAFVALFQKMNIDTRSFQPSGKTSLQTYLGNFLPHQPVILVHNVHTSEADIRFAEEAPNPVHWCLCPNANVYISRKMPPIPHFIQNHCNIVLGTDSLASNHSLSIWDEILTIQQHFPAIGLEVLLGWATLNGARALQAEDHLGSFEPGKKPGLVQIQGSVAKKLEL